MSETKPAETKPSDSGNETADFGGRVELDGQPLEGAAVTLWATTGTEAPQQVTTATTAADGSFTIADTGVSEDAVLYLVAREDAKQLAMLTLLGTNPPAKVVVNELTTVASAFTAARFINGESITGNPLGLRIAAGNTPNLVDPATGKWGKVLVDPLNSTQTTTLGNLNTLGSLISAYATVANDDWRARFLKAATPPSGVAPKTTLEAMVGIARAPCATAGRLPAQCAVRAVSRLRSG